MENWFIYMISYAYSNWDIFYNVYLFVLSFESANKRDDDDDNDQLFYSTNADDFEDKIILLTKSDAMLQV